MILAIDPGNIYSGYCIVQDDLSAIVKADKVKNEDLLAIIREEASKPYVTDYVIEAVASYGMPVGDEVFDTCIWIGRFTQTIYDYTHVMPDMIYRKEEKLCICNSPRANDATIRRALIDRFAKNVPNYGKGNRKNPGYFYGIRADMWAAFAVAVTWHDKTKGLI